MLLKTIELNIQAKNKGGSGYTKTVQLSIDTLKVNMGLLANPTKNLPVVEQIAGHLFIGDTITYCAGYRYIND